MLDFISFIVYVVLFGILTTFLFSHSHYKRNTFIQKIDDILMFKKMLMNKTINNIKPGVAKANFFLFISITYYQIGVVITEIYKGNGLIESLFSVLIGWLVFSFILRIIFEFIVIPLSSGSNSIPSPNMYMQNFPNQYQPNNFANTQPNTTYMQQPQQNTYNSTQPQTIDPNTGTVPFLNETNFGFCSQCGTRYNLADGTCPNCGMQ